MTTDVTLTIPARPDLVRLLRAVVASVGAQLDLTYDRIDDLRMVVDEASATLLRLPAQTLTMRVTPGENLVILVGSDAEANGAWPPPDVEGTLAWRVLSGLADQVSFEQTDTGPGVRIEMETGVS
ncbi:MAG: ATP-binding protein [Actinomycetota bacterium]